MNNTINITGPVGLHPPMLMPHEAQEMARLEKTLSPMFYTFAYTALTLGLVGNGLIIVIVAFDRQSRNMANLFLVNISVADVLYAASNIVGESFFLAFEDTPQELRSDYGCFVKSLVGFRFFAYAVSMFSLVALSIERYNAVCKPLTAHVNATNINIFKIGIFVCIWITSVAISVPVGLCNFEGNARAFAISLVLLLHSLPLSIIIVTNTIILLSVKSRVAPQRNREAEEGQARRRMATLLVTMIVNFIVFWSPYHFFFLYQILATPVFNPVSYFKLSIATRAAIVLSYFNPALNPFLCIFYSKNFRKGLQKLIWRQPVNDHNLTITNQRTLHRTQACTHRTHRTQACTPRRSEDKTNSAA